MDEKSFYQEYDVPQDLQFKTADILRGNGLQCSCVLSEKALEGLFDKPNRLTKAQVELSFSVANKDILVQGKVQGEREIECARCLKLTKQTFNEEFFETYSTKSEIIDIMYLVRQTLALSEEIRFLCKPDCKGLCPMCGRDLNEGPCSCKPENLSPFAALKGKFK